MGDLYASAIGTTVLQLKEIPQRPEEFHGKVVLFGVKGSASDIEAALSEFGTVVIGEVGVTMTVRFTTHEAACLARRAAPQLSHLCDGIDTLFNERSYDDRGWCIFESAVSSELIVRLDAFPRMREALAVLPSKMLQLSEAHDPKAVDLGSERPDGPVAMVRATRSLNAVLPQLTFCKFSVAKTPQFYHRELAQEMMVRPMEANRRRVPNRGRVSSWRPIANWRPVANWRPIVWS